MLSVEGRGEPEMSAVLHAPRLLLDSLVSSFFRLDHY